MSKCKYLIDISPYTPLCEHPCRLYGGGPVEAKCDVCEYRTESFEVENAKLRAEVERLKGKLFESYDETHADEVENLSLYDENFKLQQHLDAEKQRNAKLRELLQRLHKEYQYMRMRPRQMYLQHEQRMRSIEDEMRELGIEVD